MTIKDDGDIVKALGFVTLYAAYMEEAVEDCVNVLEGADEAPPKNLSKRPISERVRYVDGRLNSYGQIPDELVRMSAILNRTLELLEWRNEVIHGRIYGGLQGRGDELRPSRPENSARLITSAELYDLANQLMDIVPSLNGASMFSLQRLVARGPA